MQDAARRTSSRACCTSTIKKVTEDIEAHALQHRDLELMEFNERDVQACRRCRARRCETFVLLLAPFAPHIAEELWERLGHRDARLSPVAEADPAS